MSKEMTLEWDFRLEKKHLIDYYEKQEPNILIRVATYNTLKDTLTVYKARKNSIIHQNILEHLERVLGETK